MGEDTQEVNYLGLRHAYHEHPVFSSEQAGLNLCRRYLLVSATKGALEAGGVTPPAPGSMQAGHHRGARNVFFETLRDQETNCFKSSEELQQRECARLSVSVSTLDFPGISKLL